MSLRSLLWLSLWLGSACKTAAPTNTPEPAATPAPAAGTGGGPAASRGAAGDGGSGDAAAVPSLTIRVRSSPDGNDGRPLYVLVRAVSLKDFVEDGYKEVADLVVEPDETVLAKLVVFSGTERSVTLDQPDAKTVGVYCMFTEASGSSWKRLFEAPTSIEVIAGRDRILDGDDDQAIVVPEQPSDTAEDDAPRDSSFDWFWTYAD
ncbi:MAG: type VI secretion lipoprotein TssJ [Deltaproteobacteria bacterium]|nr:type VI secretion lipoprotein TssJ [Deltaproteobacteria bacterium]